MFPAKPLFRISLPFQKGVNFHDESLLSSPALQQSLANQVSQNKNKSEPSAEDQVELFFLLKNIFSFSSLLKKKKKKICFSCCHTGTDVNEFPNENFFLWHSGSLSLSIPHKIVNRYYLQEVFIIHLFQVILVFKTM